MWGRVRRLVVSSFSHSFFCLPLDVFSTASRIRLDLSHPLVFGVSHCICTQPLDLMGIHFLCCTHGEERMVSFDVVWDVFTAIGRCEISCFVRVDPCPFAPCLIVFVSSSWHCIINQWCSHISRRCHCWPHSSWFGFTSYYFLWGCDNSCESSKGWSLLKSIPSGHIFPSSCESFWIFTLAGKSFFHQFVNMVWEMKGIGSLPLSILCTFYKQRVLSTL